MAIPANKLTKSGRRGMLFFMKMDRFFLISVFAAIGLQGASQVSPQDEYNAALVAFQKKKWDEVRVHARKVMDGAPDSPFMSDLHFYMGAAYFHGKDYDQANQYFTQFLKNTPAPKYFEEAIVYKFQIAEKFQQGAGKHIMGFETLPKWAGAWEDAYALYDEVITTLPRHEVAAKALFNKGGMYRVDRKYADSIETFQTLIRRFPKDPLTPKSYMAIAETYFEQSSRLFPDKEFLDQAGLNAKKFRRDFPSDDRVQEVDKLLSKMQDGYAEDLWKSAHYFDKKKKIASSVLYYASIVRRFPESSFAPKALERIAELKVDHPSEVYHAMLQEN